MKPSRVARRTRKFPTDLRERAEKLLARRNQRKPRPVRAPEWQRLVHEVQLHQIELELQNEELREARDALQAQYNQLYESAPIGYLTFDKLGVIRGANTTVARMLGLEGSRLRWWKLAQLVHFNCRHQFWLFMTRLRSEGGTQRCEITLKTMSGTPVYTIVEATHFEDEYRAVVIDITSLRQAEAAQHQADALLKLAMAEAQVGVWECNRASGQIFWTQECMNIFGMEHLSITLRSLKTLVHPADWGPFLALLEESAATKTSRSLDYRVVRPDGDVRWIHSVWQVQPDIEGNLSSIVGTAKDITTEKRQVEDCRQASARMQALRRRSVNRKTVATGSQML